MKNIFKKAVLGLSLALAAVTYATAQTVDPANPYAFEKKAYKPDGTPWVGPVNVGDIIKYVLSYKPGAAPSGPVTIDDTLSPNQTYVAPTTATDSLWTWGSSPYSTGNHEQYKHPGFAPGSGVVNVTVTGVAVPLAGNGDGTVPVPIQSLNKAFGVYHHQLTSIDCWKLTDLTKCGAPVHVPNIFAPMMPQSVVRGTKFFYPAYRTTDSKAVFG